MSAGPDEAEAPRQAAVEALERGFGKVLSLERAEGGLSNHVFMARLDAGDVVVRVGEGPAKLDAYRRARLVTERVRQAGVPASKVLSIGEAGGFAVMIAQALPGATAKDHPERLRTLRDLGALVAQRIHTLSTFGFGRDFDFEPPGGERAWRDWFRDDFGAEARLGVLVDEGLVSDGQQEDLQRTLHQVLSWSAPAILNHGDLRLKNVLVGPEGEIVGLIDWEDAVSAPGPHWDLSVALHDLWIDQAQAFLDGYGMPADEVRAAAPVWRLFNALNYAPEAERAKRAQDEAALEQIRLRFSGALNLFGGPE